MKKAQGARGKQKTDQIDQSFGAATSERLTATTG